MLFRSPPPAVIAFDATGKLVTLGQPVALSGGTVASGTAAALTDGAVNAHVDVGLRYSNAAGGVAQISVSFPAADISRVIYVGKGTSGSTWGANAAMSYAAGAVLELLAADSSVVWSSPLGAPGDNALIKVFTPPAAAPIVLPELPASQTPQERAAGYRYLFLSPGSNLIYLREVIVLDNNNVNIAYGRGLLSTGSAAANIAEPGVNGVPTDLIIDTQGTSAGATSGTSNSGNTWANAVSSVNNGYRLDFGAAFNVSRIIVFHFNCIGCAAGEVSASTRNNGMRYRLYSGDNVERISTFGPATTGHGIFSASLSIASIVSPTITATPSSTASNTASVSSSGTAAATATSTETPSATLPAGGEFGVDCIGCRASCFSCRYAPMECHESSLDESS